MSRLLEAGGGRIDVAYFGEDLGTQSGPRIGLQLYREIIRPLWERHIALARKYGCFVMQHSCGSTRAFYPDLIELGVDIHDTVQPEAKDMDPEALKREFGARISFHGGISIQQVLQTGTREDVAAEVIRMIRALGRGGGYILAPTHWIQSGTPVENVLTMYQVAKEYSKEFYRK
jgi:uroporphyrinogen decarboxylase